MKAPRTPSPKCSRNTGSDSPGSSTISELTYPDSPLSSKTSTSSPGTTSNTAVVVAQRRSPMTVALGWVFCAGLFFFTTESVRFAGKVAATNNNGNSIESDFLDGVVARFTAATSMASVVDVVESETEKPVGIAFINNEHNQRKLQNALLLSADKRKKNKLPVRGTTSSSISSGISSTTAGSVSEPEMSTLNDLSMNFRRKLKMGRRRRGRGRGRGSSKGRNNRDNAPINDSVFVNGGFMPQQMGNADTRDQLTRVRTNINIFQPGIGFLPPGDPNAIILAPGRRRRGMGMGGGGMGMGMGGRSGSKGRSGSGSKGSSSRSRRRTFMPTPAPSGSPSASPSIGNVSNEPSSRPSNQPSLVPSTQPSQNPSVSLQPSSQPSLEPSSGPSVSNAPSITL